MNAQTEIKKQIEISLFLTKEQREKILEKIPSATPEELKELADIFNEEKSGQKEFIEENFKKGGEGFLFEIKRIIASASRGKSAFVEKAEKAGEEDEMEGLLDKLDEI